MYIISVSYKTTDINNAKFNSFEIQNLRSYFTNSYI